MIRKMKISKKQDFPKNLPFLNFDILIFTWLKEFPNKIVGDLGNNPSSNFVAQGQNVRNYYHKRRHMAEARHELCTWRNIGPPYCSLTEVRCAEHIASVLDTRGDKWREPVIDDRYLSRESVAFGHSFRADLLKFTTKFLHELVENTNTGVAWKFPKLG